MKLEGLLCLLCTSMIGNVCAKSVAYGEEQRAAHFRLTGRIVPYTRVIETAVAFSITNTTDKVLEVLAESEEPVADFISRHGKDHTDARALIAMAKATRDMVEHYILELESLLSGNGKRGILELVGTVLNTLQGWGNRDQISDLHDNQDMLLADIKENRNLIGKAVEALQGLKNATRGAVEYQRIVTHLELLSEHLKGGLEDTLDAVYAAAQGQVHRLVAPAETLEEVQNYAEKEGEKNGLNPIFSHSSQLLNSPRTVTLGTDGIVTVFHVPMVDKATQIMDLYHLERAEVVQEDHVEVVNVDKAFLGKDQRGWKVTISAEDLALCQKVGDLHLCYHDRQLRRGSFDCVSALFEGIDEEEWCSSTLHKHGDTHIVDLGGNLYHGTAEQATLTCPDGSTKSLDWAKPATRYVDPQCMVSGKDFLILGGHRQPLKPSLIKKFDAVQRDDTFGPAEEAEGAEDMVDSADVDLEVNDIKTELKHRQWGLQMLIYVCVGLAALVALLGLAVAFMLRRTATQKKDWMQQLGLASLLARGNDQPLRAGRHNEATEGQQQPTRETAASNHGLARGSSSSDADSEDSFMRSINGSAREERISDVARTAVAAGRTKHKVAGTKAAQKKKLQPSAQLGEDETSTTYSAFESAISQNSYEKWRLANP